MKHVALTAAFLAGMITGMSVFSRAADLYLDINGFSRHSQTHYTYQGERQAYNADNAGLGLTKQLTDGVDLMAGFYKNSFHKPSIYAGANFHINFLSGMYALRPGVSVGLVSGYDNTPDHTGMVRLCVLPNIRASIQNLGVKVGYVPAIGGSRGNVAVSVLTVQFQYQIN